MRRKKMLLKCFLHNGISITFALLQKI